MIRVLIVDDERLIRKRINRLIEKSDLSFEVVGEANNGRQAYELVKTLTPNLLITDMKMPEMDGIDLINAVNELDIKPYVIVTSAYSDFKYTKAAIQKGVIDYLLKPIDTSQLYELLKKVMELHTNQNRRSLLNQYISFFVDSFHSSVLVEEEGGQKKIVDVNMNIKYKHYIVAVIKIDCQFINRYFKKIKDLIENYCYKLQIEGTIFKNKKYKSEIFLIVGFDKCLPGDFIEQLMIKIKEVVDDKIVIGVGNIIDNFNAINASFQVAFNALSYRSILTNEGIIYSDDLLNKTIEPLHYHSERENEFLVAIEIGNLSEINNNVDALFEFIINKGNISYLQVYNLCNELLFLIERLVRKYEITLDNVYDDQIMRKDELKHLRSLEDIKKWLKQLLEKIITLIIHNKNENLSHVINKIKSDIDINYFQEISLNQMAKKYHINVSYMSILFKKEIGMNFIDYLKHIRMEKAKKLLVESNYRISDIAKLVGYKDPKYFSKEFKKYNNIGPSDYKRITKKSTP